MSNVLRIKHSQQVQLNWSIFYNGLNRSTSNGSSGLFGIDIKTRSWSTSTIYICEHSYKVWMNRRHSVAMDQASVMKCGHHKGIYSKRRMVYIEPTTFHYDRRRMENIIQKQMHALLSTAATSVDKTPPRGFSCSSATNKSVGNVSMECKIS